jgi:hypothetical protein
LVFLSDNIVSLNATWNEQSIEFPNDIAATLFAVKDGYPCNMEKTVYGEVTPYVRSNPTPFLAKHTTAQMFIDLSSTLYNQTAYATSSNVVVSTDVANTQLYSEYSLCVGYSGSDDYGFETGRSFTVLAALHVFSDTGYENAIRFPNLDQYIVIASATAVTTASTHIFLSDDKLVFTKAETCNSTTFNSALYSSQVVNANTTLYKTAATALLTAYNNKFDFSQFRASLTHDTLFHLCVQRNNKFYDFPGCAVTVVPSTKTPTRQNAFQTTAVAYSAQPYVTGGNQDFILNSVVTSTTGTSNSLTWNFTGEIKATDRLSISAAVRENNNQVKECDLSAYSFFSVVANTGGTKIASANSFDSAVSGSINGMIPGQYALCYCNTAPSGSTVVPTCRTPREFNQFVGYVFFDGSYQGSSNIKTIAVSATRASNFELKLTGALHLDRARLVPNAATCATGADQLFALTNAHMAITDNWGTKAPTTAAPTNAPTTAAPTTAAPTGAPTKLPTKAPTTAPTGAPTAPTKSPTAAPTTTTPTTAPTTAAPPTSAPTTAAPVTTARASQSSYWRTCRP